MSKPIIFCDNIDITYNLGKSNEFKANKNCTVEIYPEEYIILFGPSGCGKSTLLYSIFGVLPPSSGKIYVKGDSIYDYSSNQMVNYQRKTMGIMYQSFNLINSITVLDNVSLPLIFAGVPPFIREKRAMVLLRRFGIDHVAHKRPVMLSGGQQQRVSVARSLVNDPEILIADEPVGNLDAISSKAVMDTLHDINERDKKTIILVTHDAKHLPYAHRVYHLREGGVIGAIANPEKKQVKKILPGETIITEIEQIARLFPYSTAREHRVKSIVNYLTQDLSFDQLTRLEQTIEKILEGKMSEHTFYDVLRQEYASGGIGVGMAAAKVMSEKMQGILEQSRDISRYRDMKKRGALITAHHELVHRLCEYLLLEHKLPLTPEQMKAFSDAVSQRISGFIIKDEFKSVLLMPVSEGGVELDVPTTHSVTRYFEKLIAQGVAPKSAKE